MTDDPRKPTQKPDASPTEAFPGQDRSGPRTTISVPDYRLLRPIAAGGMGEVYEAEQLRPVRRRVAFKVIKLGMDTAEVVARFESERQALALMSHPNIARVFDAGATDQGRPFFAMELVSGEPITAYCDRHRLTTRQRLELFLEVCDGVQHAHQKGIIHRDIKPSNVLVTVAEGRPTPKIIDFGVAKATSQRLTDRTMMTQVGAMIGTPEYMSPEQAELTGLDIDTRSDVYSLGVMLYELLVGALPFDGKELRRAGFTALQRIIREDVPKRPSTRISTLGDTGAEVAHRRQTEISSLTRQLKGDLDWIILKALEKDRTRRYETANALAADIRRHLKDEPVLASPPSTIYRARKFVRRHRAMVVAGALVALALVVGFVGTSVGLLRAVRAERHATREAEAARQVSEFLVDLFQVAEPGEAQGRSITAGEILDRGAARVERELKDQPATQARLMHTIGSVYNLLGLYEEAEPLLEKALDTREELAGDDSLEAAETLLNLASLADNQGRYREARDLAQRSLVIREAELGPDHPAVAETLRILGWARSSLSQLDQAEPLFRRALAIREGDSSVSRTDVAVSRNDLGILLWRKGDFEGAERLLKLALQTYEEEVSSTDYRVRRALNDLAVLYWTQGRLTEAEDYFRRSLTIKERVLGADHPEVAGALNNLAVLLDAQDRAAEAEPLARRSLQIYEQRLGLDHDKTAMALSTVAWLDFRLGAYEEAEELYRQALGVYEATIGPRHADVAILLRDRAQLFIAQDRRTEAERDLERAISIWEETLGADHVETATTVALLADLYASQQRWADAEPLYERALEALRASLGEEHPTVTRTAEAYRGLLRATGRESDPGAG
jgi:serine/threonine protein kinase/tetratricopeptide (TPR) repeat protein